MEQLKVISLLQPWATLVVTGVKKIETRSWQTGYRGKLLIHASTGKAGSIFSEELPFKKYIPDFKKLPFGCITGEVTLTEVIHIEKLLMTDAMLNQLTMEEKAFGDYRAGRYAWLLEEAIQFKIPIPARGSLNLWNCPEETAKEILKSY